MAALDESGDVWVDEIYQIEQTDPVLGGTPNETTKAGLSNIPLQQLAKRTSWLKRFFAPVDSPELTGTPHAPTPEITDNSTRIATTGWVRAALGTLATAAGFSAQLSPNGFLKFPTWLGSVIFQWGQAQTDASGVATVLFPLVFPTAPWRCIVAESAATGWTATNAMTYGSKWLGTTGVTVIARIINNGGSVTTGPLLTFSYFVVGR